MNLEDKIKRLVGKAIFGHELLQDGDRVLIALSGGEDSLVLTYFLSLWGKAACLKVQFMALHLDMGFPKDDEAYSSQVDYLKEFVDKLGMDFRFEKTDYGLQAISAFDQGSANPCFVCSWHRRKHFFRLAQDLNFNKIALGHHLDDVIVSFFLNLFFHGEISAILPNQEMFKGRLRLIRPLFYVEKFRISNFVKNREWKILENPCPFSGQTNRTLITKLLQEQIYPLNPKIKKSIFASLFRPRLEYLPKLPKRKHKKD